MFTLVKSKSFEKKVKERKLITVITLLTSYSIFSSGLQPNASPPVENSREFQRLLHCVQIGVETLGGQAQKALMGGEVRITREKIAGTKTHSLRFIVAYM